MLKVVYDTNLIVSAALKKESLPALLLSLALEDKVRLFISPALIKEYEEVLKRPRFKLGHNEIMELIEEINQKVEVQRLQTELDNAKGLQVLPEDIAAKIESVISNPEKMSNLQKRGLLRIKDFSWKKMAQQTLSLYTGLDVHSHSAAAPQSHDGARR